MLAGQLAGGGAGVQIKKKEEGKEAKPGQGTSKFAQARREKKATTAKAASSSAPFVMADTPLLVPVSAVSSIAHVSLKLELKKQS
ncbi:hypothetical protein NCS55_00279800 [Fusarium keratoplasticum]|nr:hypothetical protein NCS55_00279800 [Fusarium keratoplasticum]